MTTTTLSPIDSGVLLEAGTNEVEILVFHVGTQRCGVNVAKVREVRPIDTVTNMPDYPESVSGVVCIRDAVVPLVNLQKYLWGNQPATQTDSQESDLLLEYNNRMVAFRVQRIERIFRVSWKALLPLPECPGLAAPVTGVLLLDGSIIALLDFESIGAVLGVNGNALALTKPQAQPTINKTDVPLVYVDDSLMIRKMLSDALDQAGYTNVRGFSDGQEAWDFFSQLAENGNIDDVRKQVGCVISDIEMPRMDGFSLTKRVRDHSLLKDTPVILFSSLISKDNEKKGIQVGATAQISKPKWEDLTMTLTRLLDEVIG